MIQVHERELPAQTERTFVPELIKKCARTLALLESLPQRSREAEGEVAAIFTSLILRQNQMFRYDLGIVAKADHWHAHPGEDGLVAIIPGNQYRANFVAFTDKVSERIKDQWFLQVQGGDWLYYLPVASIEEVIPPKIESMIALSDI